MRLLLLMAAVLSCIIIARRLGAHKPTMKTLLQMAAVLSFLFPFVFGVWLLIAALSSAGGDMLIAAAMGSFLIGNAFFVGGMLLVAAEKLNRYDGSK
jgi:hypothetical protein